MPSLKEIYKKAKEKGYDASYESFKSDYGNVPEDFDELMGKEIKLYKPKSKSTGGLISGKPKLAKRGWK